ncbi:phage shock protein C (PspC) family protein [Scopulibacillus darangshiensis]|uniref:Phage shock protein C (PspC) family protein n=1 Tax=Scopulibacillus darangshiensis TaxID=442528 RepID=A0A4R2PAJ1_9BACL|nr:PspC domain-containing protein [Scopulibacillus darangshiensis]TCP31294.1 phage shock protein C (PspC) family protein [Scopulibacillus darangshiensis]
MGKLRRSRSDRVIAGVCGGLAKILHLDSTIIRVVTVLLLVFTGFFPVGLIYILMVFLIPKETYAD